MAPREVEAGDGEADVCVELLAVGHGASRHEQEPLEDDDEDVRRGVHIELLERLRADTSDQYDGKERRGVSRKAGGNNYILET